MGKTFRRYEPDQYLLRPPDLREWLPEGHLALFVSDIVEELELSAILGEYEKGGGRGYPPYHPVMMVKLLIYGYCTGVISSRKIERATFVDVAFRVLAANQHPDHDSIATQIKEARGFRRFSFRGLKAVKAEWSLVCLTHNLLKLSRAGGLPTPA